MADNKVEERVVAELKRLITEELGLQVAAGEIDADAALFEGGVGIDSIAIVELISVAEETFGLQFTDEDLLPCSFSSLRAFAKLIATKPDLSLAR